MNSSKKPVALFVYNRPEQTQRTLASIRGYSPDQLLIVSDGAKEEDEDRALVGQVRELCDSIDWECDVLRLYHPTNVGCREAITTGLAWIFDCVDETMILEDDCLPNHSFFRYCSNLLEHYRDNPKVMSIGGYSPQRPENPETASYRFSKYPSTWGWATWRRTFEGFDPSLKNWSEARDSSWLCNHLGSTTYGRYWAYMFNRAHNGSNDWDYAWAYHCWVQDGLSIRPNFNLVQNLGFTNSATHTKDASHPFARIRSQEITIPLTHPDNADLDPLKEAELEEILYSGIRKRQLQKLRLQILKGVAQ